MAFGANHLKSLLQLLVELPMRWVDQELLKAQSQLEATTMSNQVPQFLRTWVETSRT